jgi:hypothetical protein
MIPERQVGEPEPVAPVAASHPQRRGWGALVAISGAAGLGAVLQAFIPRSNGAAAAVGAGSMIVFLVIAWALHARMRRSLVQPEAFAALLATLAAASAAGVLVPQRQPAAFYVATYGDFLGRLLLGARLDDAFHSAWFLSLAGLFCAAIAVSALQRWPPSVQTIGFHLAHLGLLGALVGAASSAAFAVRGRVEVKVGGEEARFVHLDPPGAGPPVPLGFALRLDRVDVERYGSELRVGYYEPAAGGWRLRTSFEPEQGVRHRLPGGGSFVLRAMNPRPPETASVSLTGPDGTERDEILAARAAPLPPAPSAAVGVAPVPFAPGFLVLERRPEELKALRSEVTAIGPGGEKRSAVVAVNSPFHHQGWTFHQASREPGDPGTSGFRVVRHSGAFWVLLGFGVIAAGVATAMYTHPGLRAPRK